MTCNHTCPGDNCTPDRCCEDCLSTPRRPHPDTMIGRLPCTCNQEGRAAVWHITPCEIKLVHLESLR